jgi:hypothetical protein
VQQSNGGNRTAVAQWRRNDSFASALQRNGIHRSVSDSAGDWEYADGSVRDMAGSVFCFRVWPDRDRFRKAALRP